MWGEDQGGSPMSAAPPRPDAAPMLKVTVIAQPPRLEPVAADPFIADLAPASPRRGASAVPAARAAA